MQRHNEETLEQIRIDFVQGIQTDNESKYPTIEELSKQYNIPAVTLYRKSQAEEWKTQRSDFKSNLQSEINKQKKDKLAKEAVAFDENNLRIAQVLITKNLIDDREQFINTTQALNELLAQNIIPVINENDVVATEELKFGDNDRLSAIVSIIVNASKLILVTNKQGLYNFNPDKNSDAKMIDFIQFNSSQLNDLIPISSHGEGEGGFSTKIMAAQIAGFSGIQTQIISWSEKNFVDAIEGKQVGTLILESDKKIRLRKLWIAYGMQSASKIEIDAGAFDAIKNNASLLCNGVVKIHEDFNIGDGIEVVLNDFNVAKGIAKISSNEISDNIVLIHIDDLIIL